jgi:hypothetical protein
MTYNPEEDAARCAKRDYHVGIGGFGYCTDCGFRPADKMTPPFPSDHPIWTHAGENTPAPLTFTLSITLGNDAMQTPGDVIRAVTESLNRFGAAGLGTREPFPPRREEPSGIIRDENSNTVGSWRVQ